MLVEEEGIPFEGTSRRRVFVPCAERSFVPVSRSFLLNIGKFVRLGIRQNRRNISNLVVGTYQAYFPRYTADKYQVELSCRRTRPDSLRVSVQPGHGAGLQ